MVDWLNLPSGLIGVFTGLMPGLLAEENLNNSAVAAVGSGMAKNSQAVRARWERLTQESGRNEEESGQMTKKQFRVVAATMGFGVDA